MTGFVTNSVVHLTMRVNDIELAVGTGVLYERNKKVYIVTAWHNVTGRHSESLEVLSKMKAIPNNIVAYISFRMTVSGEDYGSCRFPITIQLEENGEALYYVHHQEWPRVDVVAIPIHLDREYKSEYSSSTGERIEQLSSLITHSNGISAGRRIECIQESEYTIDSDEIDFSKYLFASDDVFILGYPKGITDHYGEPIWKRATVATSPHLGWNKQEQFLVDCASRQGMSGAPAIFYNRRGEINTGSTIYVTSGPATVFHGIYVGRFGGSSEFEAQIGRVWKRKVINEVIDKEIVGIVSEALALGDSDIEGLIMEEWPDLENYSEKVLDKDACFLGGFVFTLMKKMKGRANPKDVRRLVVKYAESHLS